MQTTSATVEIGAPAQKVWEVLADFGNIAAFNPGLIRSYLTGESAGGVGATRHCDLAVPGASIEERIIDWVDGESYTVDIYQGTRNPFASATATLGVSSIDAESSRAMMTIRWKAKGGILSGLLDRGLRGQNRKAIKGVLAGLKHHVETGAPVEARQRVDTSSVSRA